MLYLYTLVLNGVLLIENLNLIGLQDFRLINYSNISMFQLIYGSIIFNIGLTLVGVHRVKFRFEFQSELYLLLVILAVLHILFFKFESQCSFVCSVFFQLLITSLQRCNILFQKCFIIQELLAFDIEFLI